MSDSLFGSMSIAASGLQAASAMLDVTANNIANMNTPGFMPSRVDLAELSGGGVQVTGVSAEGSGAAGSSDTSQVDPAQEMVNLDLASVLYQANAAVVRTADRMLGTLVDVLAADHGDYGTRDRTDYRA